MRQRLSGSATAWSDERLDDLASSLRPLPMEVAKVTEAVDRPMAETRFLREDLSSSQRQVMQVAWGLIGVLIAALAALIAALI